MNLEIKELQDLVANQGDSNFIEKVKELKSTNNSIPLIIMAIFMMLQVKWMFTVKSTIFLKSQLTCTLFFPKSLYLLSQFLGLKPLLIIHWTFSKEQKLKCSTISYQYWSV